MYSKTPRTAVGEFVNASFTQTTKKNHVQSRVKSDSEIPRSPSFIPTPRKTAVSTRLTKSPGRALNSSRTKSPGRALNSSRTKSPGRALNSSGGGILTTNKRNSPWMPSNQKQVASASKSSMRHYYNEGRTKHGELLAKSPVNQYKELITSITKAPRHTIKHDRVSSLRSTPRMNLSLPTEELTPGTMVAAFLDGKDSTIPFVRQRARTSQTGMSMPAQLKDVKQSAVKARRRSIGESEKETPRAMIQNFLTNMNSSQTPAMASHRVQTITNDSPDLVVPSQSSYHTPSPFKSSSSERSNEKTTRSSVQRNSRRTPRPHAPFHFDVLRPVPGDTDPPSIQTVPEDVQTPSPFKSSTSDVSSPSVENAIRERSRRFDARRPREGTFLLDIPEHILEWGDNNNAKESMDSFKAQYSFDLQSSREAHDGHYAEDVIVEETQGLNEANGDYDEADNGDYNQSPRDFGQDNDHAAGVYDEIAGDYDEANDIDDKEAHGGYDEAHGGYDEAHGGYDEMEQDVVGGPSARPTDSSRNSGMNFSQAVPESFVPEFTSTQQPAQTIHNDSYEDIQEDEDNHQEEEQDDDMEVEENLPVESVTQVKPRQPRKPRQKQKYSLPVSMVKKSFMRFSDRRLSKEALEEVMKVSETYWDNVCADLKAYANHAGRKTVTMDDFVLLFKRQGHINDKVSLNALITQYLCMEDRRRLIPVARAGNRIELWK